ncbi:ABC transporter ATP-binding protein [Plasticicumulans acidivorans]|uniref:Putative ABC transport system ATP-binding protein n=1 Tax=Plasticicumulans acidivorans TaxID=886464 RepID=A0A317MWQ9_9GAMM|nr:ATP-binding cassette domain-containing protein [Plasticicumulans acidivorans]PWV62400.1 putative ABC transport system ATP-binding protein [Plasticicumulans acidivorans]
MAVTTVYRLRDVRRSRGTLGDTRFVLQVPALDIARGERLALVGPSGCGKSTLLDMLALVLAPDAGGELHLLNNDIGALWQLKRADALAALRARHLGYVLQTGGLLGFLDVRGNIALPGQLSGRADAAWVTRLAERLGISRHLDKHPAALSVGERQRVAIARALAHRPAVVLADEPTASLDPLSAQTVMQLFIDLAAESATTLILASHDRALVERYGLEVLAAQLAPASDGGIVSRFERTRR